MNFFRLNKLKKIQIKNVVHQKNFKNIHYIEYIILHFLNAVLDFYCNY